MLTNDILTHMLNVAETGAPREMCGLLFPKTNLILCRNAAKHPEHEFNIEHEEYQEACRWFGGQPWAIVHSHPGKSAKLSPQDCSLMDALQLAKMELDMVIVGLNPVEVKVWRKLGELYSLVWHWGDTD